MKWPHMAVQLTSVCSRRCENCCYLIPQIAAAGEAEHFSWEYFEDVAARVRQAYDGVGRLIVSGGEPTLHPQFGRVAREFRGMFRAKHLYLATNGARLLAYRDVWEQFDKIHLTLFTETEKIHEALKAEYHGYLYARLPIQYPMAVRPGFDRPCDLSTARHITTTFWRGSVYRCCMGPGLPSAESLPLSEFSHERVMKLKLGCDSCPLAREAHSRGEPPVGSKSGGEK